MTRRDTFTNTPADAGCYERMNAHPVDERERDEPGGTEPATEGFLIEALNACSIRAREADPFWAEHVDEQNRDWEAS